MNVKEFSFSCVSLFNYQGSCRLTAPTFYHIVFRLSSTFSKSFFAAFRHLCSFATAILDYHICISLSRTFFNFLKLFFSLFRLLCCRFATARLDYHIFLTLSTTFFLLFYIFFTSNPLMAFTIPSSDIHVNKKAEKFRKIFLLFYFIIPFKKYRNIFSSYK